MFILADLICFSVAAFIGYTKLTPLPILVSSVLYAVLNFVTAHFFLKGSFAFVFLFLTLGPQETASGFGLWSRNVLGCRFPALVLLRA